MNLYHYCSQEAFLSIIRTRTFWCSALSLSNDTMEGRWIRKIFSDICDKDKNGLEEHNKNRVLKMLGSWEVYCEGLGFCLSKHPDSLSQWRGYAQDAEGFCIGFSKEKLKELKEKTRDDNEDNEPSFTLFEVNYDITRQQKNLKPAYQKIKEIIESGEEPIGPDHLSGTIGLEVTKILSEVFRQKNPAFQEEKEWRILSIFHKLDPSDVKFRTVGNRIVPYRPFRFDRETISEVVLGPKNQTPKDIVKSVLNKFGYPLRNGPDQGVEVKKSEASYR